jgi:hypothetical protein
MDKKEVKTPPKQVVPPGNNWWYPKPGQTPLRERCDSVGSDDVSQPSSSPGIKQNKRRKTRGPVVRMMVTVLSATFNNISVKS